MEKQLRTGLGTLMVVQSYRERLLKSQSILIQSARDASVTSIKKQVGMIAS